MGGGKGGPPGPAPLGGKGGAPGGNGGTKREGCADTRHLRSKVKLDWTYCLEIQVEGDPFQEAGREGHPEDPLHQVVGGHQDREVEEKADVLVKLG